MSIELTDAERAYLIGRDWVQWADALFRHLSGDVATGVLVDDLLGEDGPYVEDS